MRSRHATTTRKAWYRPILRGTLVRPITWQGTFLMAGVYGGAVYFFVISSETLTLWFGVLFGAWLFGAAFLYHTILVRTDGPIMGIWYPGWRKRH